MSCDPDHYVFLIFNFSYSLTILFIFQLKKSFSNCIIDGIISTTWPLVFFLVFSIIVQR